MRVFVCVFAVLCLASVAHADEEDDAFISMPGHSWGVNLVGHGSRIAGHSEGGFGPSLELAIGRGRWQYLGEVMLAATALQLDAEPMADPTKGKLVHGALGLRWLARQFRFDSSGGVEMFLLSTVGGQRFYFNDGGRLSRPELALGFGLQVRGYKRPRFAFRMDARIVFTPGERDGTFVSCRGACMMESGASAGFMTGFGLAW